MHFWETAHHVVGALYVFGLQTANPWAKQCGIESQYSSISILSITPEFLVFLHLFASVLHTADEINNKLAFHPL